MEKVETLRAKANITYEEAKAVLDEADGDMLDAVILLEQRGKIKHPETEVVIREATVDEEETTDKDTNNQADKNVNNRKVQTTMRKIINVLKNNSFHISRHDEELFKMPVWAFVLILFFTWHVSIPVLIIALFFDVRYSFTGIDDLSGANEFMDKAADMADEIKN